jgi:alanyl-tRNA synthetase
MTSDQIRRQFIDFFVQKHGHTFVPSSPVVPHDDPTLLFTNAGMNQFKPIFLGIEKRPYTRAANTQKCIRAGGKHNDLDDVGRSRRHHTFFEMLGNWSFGDYFKRGAIEMAWELLTKVWKLDPTRLHVSCYEGDEKAGIPRDTEAANIWKEVAGLRDDQIHYFGKDNFWEMGETGPCGPCTEIYIDRTPDKTGGPEVNGNDPRVMEIWNLVFIQYNRDAFGKLTTLPAQHVDTGMGLERICQVLQGKDDNYGTDLFTPLFEALTKLTGIQYAGKFPPTNAADPVAEAADPQLRHDIAFRVIADHVRCLTFALTDGAVPSNEGRGYVLRRILRRAVRFGRQQLELRDPFLHKLVPVVVQTMGGMFPELTRDPQRVIELIRDEEISFSRTIDRGIDLFEEAANRAKENDEKQLVLSGEDAFKLHDTYGFPIDLTRIMAEERGMRVDIAGYERLMERARDLARAGGKAAESMLLQLPPDALALLADQGVPPTDDSAKYEAKTVSATVRGIWNGHELVSVLQTGSEAAVILDRTNFYAEMGGQVGDAGALLPTNAGVFEVVKTRQAGSYVLHIGTMRKEELRTGDVVASAVDSRRHLTEQSHTTTHLANWALREVLGDGVQQKGSLVDPEKLRFDFSHGKAMSEDELARVEDLVNRSIESRMPVYTQVVPQEQAMKIHGLRAVFGEKYPPMVRVVSIGAPVTDLLAHPENPKWRQYSIEFCGGTHLKESSEAVTFVITGEESVSKGIRRIVAATGDVALAMLAQGKSIDSLIDLSKKKPDSELGGIMNALQKSVSSGELSLRSKRRAQAAVAELQDRSRKWEKANKAETSDAKMNVAEITAILLNDASPLGPGKLIVADIPGATADQLLAVTDSLKKKAGSYGVLLGSTEGGKVSLVAAVSDDLIAQGLKAGDWIREAAKVTGGGGGGRPQMAQAGGKDPAKLPEALRIAREFAIRTLK